MRYKPHDYQAYAIDYIETHPIAAVLLDMGLGKTSITLTAIFDLLFDSFEVHRVLVIAPLRVARDTWTAEVDKWDHLQSLICSVAVGTETERKAALMRQADIYIINRENVQWLVEESGIPFTFDMIVIDELSSFKNHNTKRFKSLLKVRPKVSRIVGLTGTPASNGLMDLWAEFRILDMGQRLGRFITKYRTDYFMPDKRNGQIIYSYKPLPYAEDAIYRQISDITISMKSTDHLQMPELVSSEYIVRLSDSEQEDYEDLKRELVLTIPGGEITAANAASLSGKLSQLANGAIYDDAGDVHNIHDRKLDTLEDIIEAAKQGLDERLLTDEKCALLFSSKYDGDYIFAFDNVADAQLIESKILLARNHSDAVMKFYCFCGFDRNDRWDADFWKQDIFDLFFRIDILRRNRCLPYVMRFARYTESPYRGMYITIARWCNQPSFFKKKSLREFAICNGLDSACYKYVADFEHQFPEVAPYLDMKYK